MRVLHILPLSTTGGVETMFINFIKMMSEKNPELLDNHYIYALSISDNFKYELKKIKVNLYIYDHSKDRKLNCLQEIKKIIIDHKIDTVYGQNFLGNLLAGLCKIVVPKKLRVIAHEHGSAWSSTWKLRLANFFWSHLADQIICNSKASKIILNRKYYVSNKKLKVIYNGVPNKKIIKTRKKNQIITVGRLVAIKSTITLLNAMQILLKKYPDLKLIILGDGELKESLKIHCNNLEINDNVEFKGIIENVSEYIAQSKVLVLPSVRESLGNVIIEAGLQKVPSIGTNVDGIPEVIINNKTGFLVNPTISVSGKEFPKYVYSPEYDRIMKPKKIDPKILAQKIEEMLDRDLYKSLGEEAYKYVKEKFNFERYYDEILSELYK